MVIGTSSTSTRRRQTRQENVATLAIQVPRWLGVTAAIRILFEHLYPFPGFRTDAPHVKLLPSSAEPVDPHVGRTLRGCAATRARHGSSGKRVALWMRALRQGP